MTIRIQNATFLHAFAVVLLLIVSLAFFLARETSDLTKKRLAIFALLSLSQGAVGAIQYIQGVPELLVAIHIAGSTLVWINAWGIWLSVQRREMENSP